MARQPGRPDVRTLRLRVTGEGLDDEDLTARREAIMALGMLGSREAIGCLNDYLQKGSDFRFLAATMLVRLEVPGAGSARSASLRPPRQACA